MRSRFPVLWLLQAGFLLVWALASFALPGHVIELYSGRSAPSDVQRPAQALNRWVLEIQSVPEPSVDVKRFFSEHGDPLHHEARVWIPTDPGAPLDEWEATIRWVLSFEPPPPTRNAARIERWLLSVDELDEPPRALVDWVGPPDGEAVAHAWPAPPTRELLEWVLDADHQAPVTWLLAADQVRTRASLYLAMSLFTVLGLLSPSIRRPLARVFLMLFLFWSVAQLRGMLGPPRLEPMYLLLGAGFALGVGIVMSRTRDCPGQAFAWNVLLVLAAWCVVTSVKVLRSPALLPAELAFAVTCGLALVNAYYWLIGPNEDPPQDDAGIAQSRPPLLWTVWFVQFLLLFVVGTAALVAADWVVERFIDLEHDHLGTDLVDDQVRILGASVVGMALLSYFALRAMPDELWRRIATIFCAVFVLMAAQTIYNGISGEYTVWMFVFGLQGLVFVPVTLKLLRRDDPWFADNVERQNRALQFTDLPVFLPLSWTPLLKKRRRLFADGVAAKGKLDVVQLEGLSGDDSIPESSFFVPGRSMSATVRFSNRWYADDAATDIRGAALQLRDGTTGEVLSLLLVTGAFAPVCDVLGVRQMIDPGMRLAAAVRMRGDLREGLAAGLRRGPASYAALTYYGQIVHHWLGVDGRRELVRFRLVPDPLPGDDETGVLAGKDLAFPCPAERQSGNARPPDYLRRELALRLDRDGEATFLLQAQFHDPDAVDTDVWYDPRAEWPVSAHPWKTLGRLRLERVLDARTSEAMHFDPGIHPRAVGLPRAWGVEDPRWLGGAQRRVGGALGRLRRRRDPGRPQAEVEAAPA